MERRRSEMKLVNVAATRVGNMLEKLEDVDSLEIPATLKGLIRKMIREKMWIVS